MTYYPTLDHVLRLHAKMLRHSGGSSGLRDRNMLESAIAQPKMTFGGEDLYPTLVDKAAALGFSLVKNHPFIDGNKRVGHAAMELLLELNGHRIVADVDDAERMILDVAAGQVSREQLLDWLSRHVQPTQAD